jgi:pantoate--beta-alanine ligase
MKIIKSVKSIQRLSSNFKEQGKKIGLVPTMGFLHEGHLSLIDIAKKSNDIVVVSIFVNPTQFGPNEDYNGYPRDLTRDEKLLEEKGVDILFIPSLKDMYPNGYTTYVEVEKLSHVLCGRSRPIHFKGVTTVVAKLFNMVKPDIAVFGEKDAQQAIIIKRMVKDLNFPVKIITGPTIREKDGLAVSSRNTYLSESEREDAPVLYQALLLAKNLIENGERDATKIISSMKGLLQEKKSAKIDYISIVKKDTLEPVSRIQGEVLIALAVWFGKARLIDNITIKGGIEG